MTEQEKSKNRTNSTFRLIKKLGKGSSGTVYRGVIVKPLRNLPAGSKIAVKIIHPERMESDTVLARLKREVEIGMRVKNPNLVSIFGVEKIIYHDLVTLAILLELIEGDSLKDCIRKNSPVAEGTMLSIARQAANGLRAIHELNIVHRDVKPANLIITKHRRVVITDLGVARLPDISMKITATGTFIGTCAYASPEQFASGDDLDPRSDLYSLGVVLYELVTGKNPFRAKTLIRSIQIHLKEQVDPPSSLNPNLSPACDELILNLLAKNPADRIQSAAQLIQIIDSFGDPDSTTRIIRLPS